MKIEKKKIVHPKQTVALVATTEILINDEDVQWQRKDIAQMTAMTIMQATGAATAKTPMQTHGQHSQNQGPQQVVGVWCLPEVLHLSTLAMPTSPIDAPAP